jgi:hypothetical protein
MKRFSQMILLVLLATVTGAFAEEPATPFKNPYLADSAYAVQHGRANFSPLSGPLGPSRQLRANETTWKPFGPVNASTLMYSGSYPNGKRVIWIGGYDRVAKLDADTLEVLTTYAIGGNTFFGEEETRRDVAAMDALGDRPLVDVALKLYQEAWPAFSSWYRMLSRENELYLSHRAPDGSVSVQVYGEADANDPASKISLRRELKIPLDVSQGGIIFGLQMTSDGWVAAVMQNGTIMVASRDFKMQHAARLPDSHTDAQSNDIFKSFVRNGLVTDDQGGIYVVTRDNLHRVQWTGSALSLKESDGAWAAPYPNEKEFGSGTTPSLMGWGQHEDHLVTIADATKSNNMVVFWRDRIPEDWKGLPGFDRRVAGITPIHFGVAKDERIQVENSIIIYGYGAFINNTELAQPLPMPAQSNRGKQWLADSFYMHVPGYEPLGGTQIRWDPKTRELKTAWQSQLNFMSSICQISGPTDILYCWGSRNREWTLEGVDWNTGKSAFHYTLGKSNKYNPFGGPVIIAPNGAIDCGCPGGLGLVRVTPVATATRK